MSYVSHVTHTNRKKKSTDILKQLGVNNSITDRLKLRQRVKCLILPRLREAASDLGLYYLSWRMTVKRLDRTVLGLIKLTKNAVALWLRCGSCKLIF